MNPLADVESVKRDLDVNDELRAAFERFVKSAHGRRRDDPAETLREFARHLAGA